MTIVATIAISPVTWRWQWISRTMLDIVASGLAPARGARRVAYRFRLSPCAQGVQALITKYFAGVNRPHSVFENHIILPLTRSRSVFTGVKLEYPWGTTRLYAGAQLEREIRHAAFRPKPSPRQHRSRDPFARNCVRHTSLRTAPRRRVEALRSQYPLQPKS
jgi:hypothetical protein